MKNLNESEKQKRVQLLEDKVEKITQLMQELTERDKKIISLQNELRELRADWIEMESNINQTFMGYIGP